MKLSLSLTESADLLGRYRYAELSLFHALGRRATTAIDPAAVTYLAGAARAHAWRARLVEERLPVSLGLPGTEASTRSPGAPFDEMVELLGAPGPDEALLSSVVLVLYPAMTASYQAHLAVTRPAPDPPVARMLGRVLGDLDVVRREGETLLAKRTDSSQAEHVKGLLSRLGGPFGALPA